MIASSVKCKRKPFGFMGSSSSGAEIHPWCKWYIAPTKSNAPLKTTGLKRRHSMCAVVGCPGSYNGETSFHRFPKDLSRQVSWLKNCQKYDHVNTSTSSVCFRHYGPESFEQDLREELTCWLIVRTHLSIQPLNLRGNHLSQRRRDFMKLKQFML